MIHASHKAKTHIKIQDILVPVLILLLPAAFLAFYEFFTPQGGAALGSALAVSFVRLFLGYAISLVVGVGLALLIGNSRAGDWLTPVFDVLQNIPSFALIPVFALAFGYTNIMVVIFAATSIVWPILFYSMSALRTEHMEWSEAATVFGATGTKRIWNYLLPAVFPAIVTGSLVGISIGWEAVIGLEIIGYHSGIGVFLNSASHAGDNAALWAGLVAILILVIVINKFIWAPLLRRTSFYAE
jgi:NitT/TauT family transport system permease protein